MILDADTTLAPGTDLRADLCIVGSGAAAISLAHRLLSSGRTIVMLESSRVNERQSRAVPASALARGATGQGRQTVHRYEDPDVQPLYDGDVVGPLADLDPAFLTRSRVRCYGGSTNCWGGWTRPFDAIDFDRRDLDPRFTWPIAYDALYDAYNLAIQYCSLGHWDVSAYNDPQAWSLACAPERPIAPLTLSAGSPLRSAVVAIVNGDDTSASRDGRLAFQDVWGCSLATAPQVRIYRNANVRYLETTTGGDSVRRVSVSSVRDGKAGHDFTVTADRYVIAAGGIENARLLLASDGVGNHDDQVGRHFMLHPVNQQAATFTAGQPPPRAVRAFYSGVTVGRDPYPPSIVGILMPTAEAMRQHGIGNFRVRFPSQTHIDFSWEQTPNPESRVTLSRERDPLFGDPRVKLDWQMTALDRHTQEAGLRLALEALAACGYVQTWQQDLRVQLPGDHHVGTTRMAREPADGVVDGDCRVHGVDNLYLAGSSVFATCGIAHPTLTIVALALRLAQHLATC